MFILCKIGLHWWTELTPRAGWNIFRCTRCGQTRWVVAD